MAYMLFRNQTLRKTDMVKQNILIVTCLIFDKYKLNTQQLVKMFNFFLSLLIDFLLSVDLLTVSIFFSEY